MIKRLTSPTTVTIIMAALVAFLGGAITGHRVQQDDLLTYLAKVAQLVPGAFTYDTAETVPAASDLKPLATFWEARKELKKRFYRPIEDETVLTYGAIRGMLAACDDPFTRLMVPEDFAEFEHENEGNFEGIGAVLGVRDSEEDNGQTLTEVVIQSVIEDGPAEKRGLRPKDVIIGVDDIAIRGLRLDQVVDRIRGPQGTTVKLTVTRDDSDEPVEIPIVRDRIEYPVVEFEMKDDDIGFIHLRQFNRPAAAKMRAGLKDLLDQGAKGIVLDLSGNGGGLLDTAIEIESLFLNGGPAAWIVEKGAEDPEVLEASAGVLVPQSIPMVCLVNEGSASASEILAGALQDRDRATIVGQHTYGKSKVQTIVQLGDKSAMLITTALWLTPDQHDIGLVREGKVGVLPDVEFDEWTPESKLTGGEWHDLQVDQAMEVLRKKMTEVGAMPRPSIADGV